VRLAETGRNGFEALPAGVVVSPFGRDGFYVNPAGPARSKRDPEINRSAGLRELRLVSQFGNVFGRIQDRDGGRDLVDCLQDLRKGSPWSGLPSTNLILEPSDQALPAQEFGIPNTRDHLISHFLD
jgi:hypothetical protein